LLGDQRQHGGVGEMGWIGRRSEGSGMLCALRYSHWVSLEHTVGRGMWGWMRLCRKVQIDLWKVLFYTSLSLAFYSMPANGSCLGSSCALQGKRLS
jgi:hypothetical protein